MKNESLPEHQNLAPFNKVLIGMSLVLCFVVLLMLLIDAWTKSELRWDENFSTVTAIIGVMTLILNPTLNKPHAFKKQDLLIDLGFLLIFLVVNSLFFWVRFSFLETAAWAWFMLGFNVLCILRAVQRNFFTPNLDHEH
jgi:hypothetical protein